VARSLFFRPQDIGPLTDDERHCIAFLPGAVQGYYCSNPRPIEVFGHGEEVVTQLARTYSDTDLIQPTPAYFDPALFTTLPEVPI
jgi:predicted RNA-binding protein with PUA-like domain